LEKEGSEVCGWDEMRRRLSCQLRYGDARRPVRENAEWSSL